MSHDYVQTRIKITDPSADNSTKVNFNTTGSKMLFAPAVPVQVLKWGFIPDATFTTAAAFQLSITSRPTIGGADTTLDTLTVGNAVVVAAGQGMYRDGFTAVAQATGSDGSLVNVAGVKEQVNPGQALTIQVVTAAGAAATGLVFIEYVEKAFIDKVGADVSGTPAQVTLLIKKNS